MHRPLGIGALRTMATLPTQSRVAVIGLGIAGITSVKNLVEQGFEDVTGFEQSENIGGLWQHDENPKKTTALKTTRANGSKHFSAFQDFPFPDDVPHYPSAAQVADYLRAYARQFNIDKHFRLGSKVIRLAPAPLSASSSLANGDAVDAEHSKNDEPSKKWSLRYADATGEHEEIFDKVLVTNGPWGRTFIPTLPGMSEYQGKVLHAQAYKSAEPYKGKKVVVVGMGNTGGDIAVSLVGTAAEVYASHRSGMRILKRFNGKSTTPFDHRLTRRRWASGAKMNARFPRFTSWFGSFVTELMFKWYNPRYKAEWGFFPAPPLASSAAAMQDDLVRLMADGEVHNLFGIKAFTPTGMITTHRDGTGEVETECDAVIFATGYAADFTFCQGEANPYAYPTPEWDALGTNNNLVPYPYLYMTLFSPSSPESLAFIGPCRGFSAIAFSNCDSSAQAICQVWKGEYNLPPEKQRLEWCHEVYQRNLRVAKLYRNTRTGMDPLEFEHWLNEVVGNQVNERFGWGTEAWKFWWSDRKLYKLIMDGVNTPFVYRLWEGKEGSRKRWEGARKAIYHANGLTLSE